MTLCLFFLGFAFTMVLFLGRCSPPGGNTVIGISRYTSSLELYCRQCREDLVCIGSCALPWGQSPQNGMRRLQKEEWSPKEEILSKPSFPQGCIVEQLLGQAHLGQHPGYPLGASGTPFSPGFGSPYHATEYLLCWSLPGSPHPRLDRCSHSRNTTPSIRKHITGQKAPGECLQDMELHFQERSFWIAGYSTCEDLSQKRNLWSIFLKPEKFSKQTEKGKT